MGAERSAARGTLCWRTFCTYFRVVPHGGRVSSKQNIGLNKAQLQQEQRPRSIRPQRRSEPVGFSHIWGYFPPEQRRRGATPTVPARGEMPSAVPWPKGRPASKLRAPTALFQHRTPR